MKVENLCNFYASKYHLSITLLEYLKGKNTKKSTIITFFENGIEDEIEILKSKYKMNIDVAKEIKFEETKDIESKKIQEKKDMIFIINGSYDYMKKANEYVERSIKNFKSESVKIINCFDFEIQKLCMKEILSNNDKILYTTGEQVIK